MTASRAGLTSIIVVAVATGVVCGQNNQADTATLIEALQLGPGSVVAEIGAGDGDITVALASHVGTRGRVYTSELGQERLARLRSAVEKAAAANVEIVEGRDREANLPDACCDAIFMRNVYHHFTDPAAMHASFLRALKPGGRIAIIDFRPPAATAAPGQRAANGSHGVSDDTVAAELSAAGFDVLSTDERGNRWFIVVAAKPRPAGAAAGARQWP